MQPVSPLITAKHSFLHPLPGRGTGGATTGPRAARTRGAGRPMAKAQHGGCAWQNVGKHPMLHGEMMVIHGA